VAIAEFATISALRSADHALYGTICRNGWHDLFEPLARTKPANGYWNKARCRQEAAKFSKRSEFQRGAPAAYDAAYSKGWLDDICGHMKVGGNRHLRAVYILRASGTRMVYIGLSFAPKIRYRAHCRARKLGPARIVRGPHTFKVLTRFLPVEAAQAMERALIARFAESGWDVLNLRPGGEPGGGVLKWTREALQAVADQCVTRGEMVRKHFTAYGIASKANLLEDLFAQHPNQGFREDIARDYTVEELTRVAGAYASRMEFKTAHPGAWQGAYRLGVLDRIFADHPNGGRRYHAPWTENEIRAAAFGCTSQSDFKRKNYPAFRAASRRGLLTDLFPGVARRSPAEAPT
jgi:predicted GIY-YIG superfamily endonuclease